MTNTRGILLTMISAITFGFAFTLAPMTYGENGSNPVTLTFLRNFLCLPVLLAILWFQKVSLRVTKKELTSLIILGSIGNVTTTLMLNLSFALIDVGIALTVHFIYPIFVTLACVFLYKERMSMQEIASLCIAMLGVATFFLGIDNDSAKNDNMLIGLFLAVASGVSYSFYLIYMDKSGLKNQPIFKTTFYVSLTSAICMAIFGVGTGQLTFALTREAWIISLVFSLLCTVVALSLLQIGIKHVGAASVAILTTFEPITGVVFGVILLGERITAIKIIACVLIFAGVVMLALAKQHQKKEDKPPELAQPA